eukprot:356598-Pelagomonas_calceolata.AAC.4
MQAANHCLPILLGMKQAGYATQTYKSTKQRGKVQKSCSPSQQQSTGLFVFNQCTTHSLGQVEFFQPDRPQAPDPATA